MLEAQHSFPFRYALMLFLSLGSGDQKRSAHGCDQRSIASLTIASKRKRASALADYHFPFFDLVGHHFVFYFLLFARQLDQRPLISFLVWAYSSFFFINKRPNNKKLKMENDNRFLTDRFPQDTFGLFFYNFWPNNCVLSSGIDRLGQESVGSSVLHIFFYNRLWAHNRRKE